MMYTTGEEVRQGDVVKMDDHHFMGIEEHGYLLALCRYGTVRSVWQNNDQLSVRYEKVQDVAYAANNPLRTEVSIFAHDSYTFPVDVRFVERGVYTEEGTYDEV